ncbi:MAG: copper resistance protein CopC [Rhodoluna sp.]
MIRRFTAVIAAALMALFVVLGTSTMASAHSDTFQSVPANDAVVSTPVVELQFTFVEAVQQEFAPEVSLVNSDGAVAELGAPTFDVTGATMTVPVVAGALPNGSYTASYRIVSQDGHPASGSIAFTIEGSDADPLSEAVPAEEEAVVTEADEELMVTSSGAEGDNGQLQLALGLGAAGAVALAAVLVIVALRRRRNSSGN